MKKITFSHLQIGITIWLAFLAACNKELKPYTATWSGKLLEEGSNRPIVGGKLLLLKGKSNGLLSSPSYVTIDEQETKADGSFSFPWEDATDGHFYVIHPSAGGYFDVVNYTYPPIYNSDNPFFSKDIVLRAIGYLRLHVQRVTDDYKEISVDLLRREKHGFKFISYV